MKYLAAFGVIAGTGTLIWLGIHFGSRWIDKMLNFDPAQRRPEKILLQARRPDGGDWIDIFPSQLQWMAKEGNDVRAIERDR